MLFASNLYGMGSLLTACLLSSDKTVLCICSKGKKLGLIFTCLSMPQGAVWVMLRV